MTFIIVLLIAIVLLAIFAISIYNSLVGLRNQVKNAWSQIDVQLKRRADLIPNLMETVKGYMNHERGTLEAVTKARSAIMTAKTPQESMDADTMLTGALKTLSAVAESYP